MDPDYVRAKILHGYLLPFEEEIMKLQDIMFLRRKKAAISFLLVVNCFFGGIYIIIQPNIFMTIQIIWISIKFRDAIYRFAYRHYFKRKIVDLKKKPKEIRYSVAQISAFLESVLFFVKEIFQYSIEIAFQFDTPKVIFILTSLLFLAVILSYIPDFIILWAFTDFCFFLPLIIKHFTFTPPESKSHKQSKSINKEENKTEKPEIEIEHSKND